MGKLTMILMVVFMLLLYGGIHYYIGKRLFKWVQFLFPKISGPLFAVLFTVVALSIFFAFMPLPNFLSAFVHSVAMYWMGIFIYLLLFFLLVDLVLGIGVLTKLLPSPLPTNYRFYASSFVLALTALTVGYGIYNATQVKEVSYEVQTAETVNAVNMKIVVISDLHLGALKSETRIEEVVKRINDMSPDLVVMPGDIFNDDFDTIKNPEKIAELFRSIKATYGVYGTLGNHDGGKTFPKMVQFLKDSNIKLLTDEYEIIDNRLALVGRVDPSPIGGFGDGLKRQDVSHLLAEIDPSMPVVVLDHTPSDLDEYENKNVDLILSGHTHRGQLYPGELITGLVFEVDYGLYQRSETSPHVIVTSGVGTWGMPMRVGTYNEIVEINLK